MLYSFFCVIPRRLNFMYRRFGTPCLFRLHRLTPPVRMEQTGCFETSEHKIQTPGNHQKEIKQHSEHGESLKSRSTFHS